MEGAVVCPKLPLDWGSQHPSSGKKQPPPSTDPTQCSPA